MSHGLIPNDLETDKRFVKRIDTWRIRALTHLEAQSLRSHERNTKGLHTWTRRGEDTRI